MGDGTPSNPPIMRRAEYLNTMRVAICSRGMAHALRESVPTDTRQMEVRKSSCGVSDLSRWPSRAEEGRMTWLKCVMEWLTGAAPCRGGRSLIRVEYQHVGWHWISYIARRNIPSGDTLRHRLPVVQVYKEGADSPCFVINSELRIDYRNTGTTQHRDGWRHEPVSAQNCRAWTNRYAYFAFAAVGQ